MSAEKVLSNMETRARLNLESKRQFNFLGLTMRIEYLKDLTLTGRIESNETHVANLTISCKRIT